MLTVAMRVNDSGSGSGSGSFGGGDCERREGARANREMLRFR